MPICALSAGCSAISASAGVHQSRSSTSICAPCGRCISNSSSQANVMQTSLSRKAASTTWLSTWSPPACGSCWARQLTQDEPAMTAMIDPQATVGPNVRLGQFVVVESGATIGAGAELGHHVVVHRDTVIGDGTWVADSAVLGRPPRPAATSSVQAPPDLPPLRIGNNCIIGAGAVIYAGSTLGSNTLVGDHAFV